MKQTFLFGGCSISYGSCADDVLLITGNWNTGNGSSISSMIMPEGFPLSARGVDGEGSVMVADPAVDCFNFKDCPTRSRLGLGS